MTDPVAEPARGRFAAIVLAGSRGADDPVARAAGISHKCLAPVDGLPMIARVLETLSRSPSIGTVAVSIERPQLLQDLPGMAAEKRAKLTILRAGETPCLSILEATEQLGNPIPYVIVTADHPLLTCEMVEAFCTAALSSGADIVAGLTPAETIQAGYPETRRTYLKFQDGRFSGCNLFAILSKDGLHGIEFWRRVEKDRKKPWRIALAIGPLALLRFLLRRLSRAGAMRQLSGAINAKAETVVVDFAEAAIDVDKPDDLALADEILRRRRLAAPASS